MRYLDSALKVSKCMILLSMALVMFGCVKIPEIKPWVAPYERSLLSREEMIRVRHSHPGQFREHVYAVRGAAQGATGTQGGGCGCN
ncbi:DUF4266 domain-containing protein [Litoribacillus peritrichatus]|uniref:DUF4266 domain-containing protein n=1 Tax=Litoribacillus peritrichatus TaxID=718191 RepID=A0ABP7N5F9_9GAMM